MSVLERTRLMAVDVTIPISTVLLQCIKIALDRDIPDLKAWALNEIHGYRVGEKVPDYRILPGGLKAYTDNGFRRDVISVPTKILANIDWYDPLHIEVRQGIQELELLDPRQQYKADAPETIRAWIQAHIPGSIYASVYHEFIGASAAGIIAKVRTQVLIYLDGLLDEHDEEGETDLGQSRSVKLDNFVPLASVINVSSGGHINFAQRISSTVTVSDPVQEGDWSSLSRYLIEQGVSPEDVTELKGILDDLSGNDGYLIQNQQTEEWKERVSGKLVVGSGTILREAATQILSGALLQYIGFGN